MATSSPQYSLSSGEPLPPIKGPKLHPFRYPKDEVDVQDLISHRRNELTDNVGHAHVFKVSIRGQDYALKVFKFFDLQQARQDTFPFLNDEADDATFTFHCDPFFAECRAYGKIREIQAQRQADANAKARKRRAATQNTTDDVDVQAKPVSELAVECYGYLALPAIPYEDIFKNRFNVTDWNRDKSDCERPKHERQPFRALVKQLVENRKALVNPPRMLRALKIMRNEGLYQRDVYAGNYLGGLLVDFSVAWTTPHWILKELIEPNKTRQLDRELYDFDRMMRDGRIRTRTRAIGNPAAHRLRPRKRGFVSRK